MAKKKSKIYTKVVFDMSTGNMIEEEFFDYDGDLALCEGEGGEGEGDAPEWVETLPQDIRDWDEVKNSDSPEKFWDQMVNMRSRMGSSIRIPSNDAGEEDRKAFHEKLKEKVPGLMETPNFDDEDTLTELYGKLGRPAEAKDYATPEFKNSKGEVIKNINTSIIDSFKEQAHKAGMTQAQFKHAVESFVSPNLIKYEEVQSKAAEDRQALATEWGMATERNSKMVENFLKHTDAPASVLKAIETGSMDRTSMLWFHKLASESVKGPGSFQEDDSNKGVMTPEEATLKISEIRKNKDHAYNNKMDPGHAMARKVMRDLYLIKNPKSGTNAAPGTGFPIGGV